MRRRKTAGEGIGALRKPEKPQTPDCTTCINRWSCDRYEENTFCGRWASRAPELSGVDPNRLWETGEEVDL